MSTHILSMLLLAPALLAPAALAQSVDVGSGALTVTVEEGWAWTGTKVVSKDVTVTSNVAPDINNRYTVMYFYGSNPTDITSLCVGYKANANLASCYVLCASSLSGPMYVGSVQVTPYGVWCNHVAVGAPGVASVYGFGVAVPTYGSGVCIQYMNNYGVSPAPPTQNLFCFSPTAQAANGPAERPLAGLLP